MPRTNDPARTGLQPLQRATGNELLKTTSADSGGNATRVADILGDLGIGFSSGGLGRLSADMTKVRRRTGSAIIACVGTSLTAGGGSGAAVGPGAGSSAASPNMKRSRAWPALMAAALVAAGIPARDDAVFGSGNQGAYPNAVTDCTAYYEGQVAVAGAVTIPASGGPGGRLWLLGDATAKWTFQPKFAADTIRFCVIDLAASAYTVTDASGAVLGTFASSGNFVKRVVTVKLAAPSTGPLTINVTGGTLYVLGAIPSLSFAPMVEVWNMGAYGSDTAFWAAADPRAWLALLQPRFVAVELGANDAAGGVAPATYQANLTTLVADVKGYADIAMIKGPKSFNQPAGTGFDLPASYLAAIDAVGAANGALLTLDFNTLSSGFGAGDYFDAVGPHTSQQGNAKEAAYAVSQLLAVA